MLKIPEIVVRKILQIVWNRRYAIWLISVVLAMASFGLARLAGVPAGIDLLLSFLGAVVGTALGGQLILRLRGPEPEPEPAPPPPRRRGTGRRAR